MAVRCGYADRKPYITAFRKHLPQRIRPAMQARAAPTLLYKVYGRRYHTCGECKRVGRTKGDYRGIPKRYIAPRHKQKDSHTPV